MAGLIQAAAAQQPQGGSKLSPDALTAQMHLNPQQKPQFDRIVAAGMRIMFDEKTHKLMVEQLQSAGPMPQKLGEGIAGLLGLLVREAKGSLPPDLLIPAGIVLMAHAVDFLNQAGAPVSDEDFGAGVDVLVSTVLQQFKIDSNKVAAIAGDAESMAGAQGQQPAAPQPAQPAAMPQPGEEVQ